MTILRRRRAHLLTWQEVYQRLSESICAHCPGRQQVYRPSLSSERVHRGQRAARKLADLLSCFRSGRREIY